MMKVSLMFSSRVLSILKTALYILAGLALLLGLITGISLIGGAGSITANFVLPLQLIGGTVAANLIAPMLSSLLINLGILALVLSLIFSALLYAAARLIAHILHLEERLAKLEEKR